MYYNDFFTDLNQLSAICSAMAFLDRQTFWELFHFWYFSRFLFEIGYENVSQGTWNADDIFLILGREIKGK